MTLPSCFGSLPGTRYTSEPTPLLSVWSNQWQALKSINNTQLRLISSSCSSCSPHPNVHWTWPLELSDLSTAFTLFLSCLQLHILGSFELFIFLYYLWFLLLHTHKYVLVLLLHIHWNCLFLVYLYRFIIVYIVCTVYIHCIYLAFYLCYVQCFSFSFFFVDPLLLWQNNFPVWN